MTPFRPSRPIVQNCAIGRPIHFTLKEYCYPENFGGEKRNRYVALITMAYTMQYSAPKYSSEVTGVTGKILLNLYLRTYYLYYIKNS